MKHTSTQTSDPFAVHSLSFKAMGSPCTVHAQGEREHALAVLQLAKQEVLRLEQKYSRYLNTSVTQRINQHAGQTKVDVDAETAGLLNYAQICFEQSDGLFDITSGVLRRVWNFRENRLPRQQDIEACLKSVGWQFVLWDGQQVQFERPDMELDFGGVVKEFAADRVAALCEQQGLTAGLIELGGDIRVIGPKQTADQQSEPWMVGIRHPQTGEAMASIPVWQGGVATSGSYERFMVVNGQRYCHILNPKTGWPVRGVASVSVLAPQCVVAGSLTTMAMLKGEQGHDWLAEQDATFLLLSDDGVISGTLDAGVFN